MSASIPIFPLNTVVMPGQVLPLRIFEERYLALLSHLQEIEDPTQRLFGTVAIRDGHEVGAPAQAWFRVGCLLQLTDVEANPDGSFDVQAVGRSRLRLNSLDQTGAFPSGEVELLDDPVPPHTDQHLPRARAVFETYRQVLSEVTGEELLLGDLPKDPTMLAWSISAASMLPMPERQALLEESDVALRISLAVELMEAEIRTMRAMPSLPALGIGRNAWSPN